MMKEMRQAGIAHGDLQHGNILMCGKDIRLVEPIFARGRNGEIIRNR